MDRLDHGFGHAAFPEMVAPPSRAVAACTLGDGCPCVPPTPVRDAVN